MSDLCDRLPDFVDGTLPEAQLVEFAAHLARCRRCQQGYERLMQFDALALASGSNERAGPPRRVFPRRWGGRAALAAAAAILLLVAGAALTPPIARWTFDAHATLAALAADLPLQRTEPRVYGGPLDRHRVYSPLADDDPAPSLLPAGDVSGFEAAGDERAVAALQLLAGQPKVATARLEALPFTPEVGSDLAAAYVVQGRHEDALDALERVLDAEPRHERALWNRALALRELGLYHGAIAAFEASAAASKDEDWRLDALGRADRLRRIIDPWREAWFGVWKAGERWIEGREPIPEDLVDRVPGLSRFYFYAAVRSAGSKEEVEAMRPIAERLERHHGDRALSRYVTWASKRDFAQRAPLAAKYRKLWMKALSEEETMALQRALERSRETDILLGVWEETGVLEEAPERFSRVARRHEDTWLELLAEREKGRRAWESGDYVSAEAILRRAIHRARVPYRKVDLQQTLAWILREQHRPAEVEQLADRALASAARISEWDRYSRLLRERSVVESHRFRLGAMKAFIDEYMAFWPESQRAQQYGRESLAKRHLYRGQGAPAARMLMELERLSISGAWTLVDAYRTGDTDLTYEDVLDEVDAMRPTADDPGRQVQRVMVRGRLMLDGDAEEGRALLERAIEMADALPARDANALRGRTHALLSLAIHAGERGEPDEALATLARYAGASVPEACVVGVALDDERTLAVWRDASGETRMRYDPHGVQSIVDADYEALVPEAAVEQLEACSAVEVFAHPPTSARAEILPPGLPWAHRLGPSGGEDEASRGPSLLVSDVIVPSALRERLDSLPAVSPPAGRDVVHLRRGAATPKGVLKAMETASDVEIHAHGLVDLGMSSASMIVLSEGDDGDFALTAHEIAAADLGGRPIVYLGACRAAQTPGVLHKSWGLPAALLQAGARAVFASAREVPADQVGGLFDAIRTEIRRGRHPAVALAAVRGPLLAEDPRHWSRHLVVFVR